MDQNELIQTVAAGLFANCDLVAGTTLLAYDYLLTFQKERKYIWDAPWTPGKVLFLVARYMPFIDIPVLLTSLSPRSSLSCTFAAYWQTITIGIACDLANIVYGLRTWALWRRSRILGGLIILCGVGLSIGAILVLLPQSQAAPSSYTGRILEYYGCFDPPSSGNGVWKAYLLTGCFQLVLFLATFTRGVQHWRGRPEKLTSVLYRDAFLAFGTQVGADIVNIILLSTMGDTNYSINVTYRALLSILPARIILNIREAVTEDNLNSWDVTVDLDSTTTAELPVATVESHAVQSQERKSDRQPGRSSIPAMKGRIAKLFERTSR